MIIRDDYETIIDWCVPDGEEGALTDSGEPEMTEKIMRYIGSDIKESISIEEASRLNDMIGCHEHIFINKSLVRIKRWEKQE